MNSTESLHGIEEITAAVNKLVKRQGLTVEMVISRIEERLFNGCMASPDTSRPPTAYVDFNAYGMANLVLHVCQMGGYLAPGREELRILVDHRDNTVQEAVDILFDSNPELPTCIQLGDKFYTFDGLLKFDVYAVLMDYLALVQSDEPLRINADQALHTQTEPLDFSPDDPRSMPTG